LYRLVQAHPRITLAVSSIPFFFPFLYYNCFETTSCVGYWKLPGHCDTNEFWKRNVDRIWMRNKLHPALNDFLPKGAHVTEIGLRPYSLKSVELLPHTAQHYFIDPESSTSYPYFLHGSILDVDQKFPSHGNTYDLVFSVGVLGHVELKDGVSVWSNGTVDQYARSCYFFLKTNGILFLHLSTGSFVDRYLAILDNYFEPIRISLSLPSHETITSSDGSTFHFVILKKRSVPSKLGLSNIEEAKRAVMNVAEIQ
jgi:hypothetical protein